MPVKPIPEGYSTLTPYLILDDANAAMAFYAKVFGAKELYRTALPDGRIAHAEMQIGTSRVMLADAFPERGIRSAKDFGGTPVMLQMYVEDVDAVFKRAVDAGAKAERPVENQFYGDRSGSFTDPFGHSWNVSTHVEDVSEEEMEKRMKEHAK